MTSMPSYVPVPSSAAAIDSPTTILPPEQPHGPPIRTPQPSFPPSSSSAPPPTRRFSVPSTASISTNVSDMLLSSLLPPNLPKSQHVGGKGGPGRPRELSSQKEALSLQLMSNNFRRFVTRVSWSNFCISNDRFTQTVLGRTVLLDARSGGRGLVLAETQMDLGVPLNVDIHLYVFTLGSAPSILTRMQLLIQDYSSCCHLPPLSSSFFTFTNETIQSHQSSV